LDYQNYFDEWHSPEMAYIVGFIAADGYVHRKNNALEITLGVKDRDHLEAIRGLIGSPRPLRELSKYKTVSLRLSSKNLVDRLYDIGITQKKSLTLEWINACPDHLIYDMIRGYFDGDGHIGICTGKSLVVEFLGTEHFLAALVTYCGFGNPTIKNGSNAHRIRCSGRKAFEFCEKIYYENAFCLPRKRDVFLRAIVDAPPKKPKASRFYGVYRVKGSKKNPWGACVAHQRKTHHLGAYPTEIQAARVYNDYVLAQGFKSRLNDL